MEFLSKLKDLNQKTIDSYYESRLFECRDSILESLESLLSDSSFQENCQGDITEESQEIKTDIICRLGLVYSHLGEFNDSEKLILSNLEKTISELSQCKLRYAMGRCYITMRKHHLAEDELQIVADIGSKDLVSFELKELAYKSLEKLAEINYMVLAFKTAWDLLEKA